MRNVTPERTHQRLFCGIDVGSTNVKVILIDDAAQTLWTKAIPVPRVPDRDGGKDAVATDVSQLVSTVEDLIVEGWHATGAAAPLAALAVTGVGEDGVPVDAALRPLDTAIPWFDRRADTLATLDATLGNLADMKIKAGVKLDFSRTAAKWRWLRAHRQAAMARASCWLTLTDYPAAWWAQRPFISETLAARTACYDVFARRWSQPMLAACGAPPLPRVESAGTVIGTVSVGRLLSSGAATTDTLVIAGGHDHPIAASAVRRLHPDAIVDSLGTANLLYGEIDTISPRTDPFIAFSVPVSGRPGLACLGVYEFAASLAPFRQASTAGDDGARSGNTAPTTDIADTSDTTDTADIADTPNTASGDTLLQCYLAGDHAAGDPGTLQAITSALRHALQPDASAPPRIDVPHLRLALEAGCLYARCMREAIATAQSAGSDRPAAATRAPIYVVGGWSRSNALLQIRASALGEPVHTVEEDELTALGVALIAREAVAKEPALAGSMAASSGLSSAFSSSFSSTSSLALPTLPGFHRTTHRFEPVPAWRDAYDRLYPAFRDYALAELRSLAEHGAA